MVIGVKTLAQYRLQHPSGDSAQDIVHTWAFLLDDADKVASAGSANSALLTFYNAVDVYFSADFNSAAETVKWYDLSDPKPRTPFRSDGLANVTAGTDKLPGQIALCMSFHAQYVSGTNPARKKGRIFLGPLAPAANQGTTGRPTSTARTAIRDAAAALLTASNSSSLYKWCVYSRVADTHWYVIGGWVDDAFDVQRRRQAPVTARSTFP